MIQLKIEDTLRIPKRGYVISVRGDCSRIHIGSILVYPDGKEVRINGIATMCGGFRENWRDLLVGEGIDPKETTVYLKE